MAGYRIEQGGRFDVLVLESTPLVKVPFQVAAADPDGELRRLVIARALRLAIQASNTRNSPDPMAQPSRSADKPES